MSLGDAGVELVGPYPSRRCRFGRTQRGKYGFPGWGGHRTDVDPVGHHHHRRMHERVDQARQQCPSGQVQCLGPRPDEYRDLFHSADRGDAPVADGDGLGSGPGCVHRQDRPSTDYQVRKHADALVARWNRPPSSSVLHPCGAGRSCHGNRFTGEEGQGNAGFTHVRTTLLAQVRPKSKASNMTCPWRQNVSWG